MHRAAYAAVLIFALGVAGAASPTAQAGRPTAPQIRGLDRALSIAERVWKPACGKLQVIVQTPDHSWAGSEDWAGWASPGDCTIGLSTRTAQGPWPLLCDTILHEAGHVAGFRDPTNIADPAHSRNANSIMFAFGVRTEMNGVYVDVDPRCRKLSLKRG